MIVVADSSPLIILAKLGCFDMLEKPYSRLYISPEVHGEVVVAGGNRGHPPIIIELRRYAY